MTFILCFSMPTEHVQHVGGRVLFVSCVRFEGHGSRALLAVGSVQDS
jgi:hypothetical protein